MKKAAKVSYPKINDTPFDSKRKEDFDSWRKDLEYLLKEELDLIGIMTSEKELKTIAWNIAFMIVTQ